MALSCRDLIADCKTHEYKIAYEGETPRSENKGYFIPITVVDNPPDDARVVREERKYQYAPQSPLLQR